MHRSDPGSNDALSNRASTPVKSDGSAWAGLLIPYRRQLHPGGLASDAAELSRA